MNEKSKSPPARRVARCSRRASPKLRGVAMPGAKSTCSALRVGEPGRERGGQCEPTQLAPDRARSRRRDTARRRPCAGRAASTACASRTPTSTPASSSSVTVAAIAEVDRSVAQVAERSRNRRDDLDHLAHADRGERGKAEQHHERHRQRRPAHSGQAGSESGNGAHRQQQHPLRARLVMERGLAQSAPGGERVDAREDDDARKDERKRRRTRDRVRPRAEERKDDRAQQHRARDATSRCCRGAGTARCRRCR